MSARFADLDRARRDGLDVFTPAEALRALEWVLLENPVHVTPVRADWNRWTEAHPGLRLTSELGTQTSLRLDKEVLDALGAVLGAAAGERLEVLERYVREIAARALRMEPQQLDVAAALTDVGIDSIMAVELRSEIERRLGMTVPIVDLLSGASARDVAQRLEPQLAEAGMAIAEVAGA